MSRWFIKLTVGFTLLSLVAATLAIPRPAQAIIPVSVDADINAVFFAHLSTLPAILTAVGGTAASTAGDAISNAGNLAEKLYEWAKLLLTQTLKKALLDYLVDRVITYIQGQSDGGFIGDWQGFLKDVATNEFNKFTNDFAGIDICTPFKAQLQIAFAIPPTQRFKYKVTCSFDEATANMQTFMHDFKSGDWIAYNAVLQPQNNFYGVYISGIIEQERRTDDAKQASLAEGVAGAGFLGSKKCTDPNDPKTCTVVTPGSVVGNAVFKAVGSDFDFITNANDLSAYASAITNALVGRVLTEGLALAQHAQPGNDISNYIDVASIQRSDRQQFENQRQRLIKDVSKALSLRLAAQAVVDNAQATWLKYTHSNPDILAEAHSQVLTAKDALLYIYGEVTKVTDISQIHRYRSDVSAEYNRWSLCRPVYNLSKIQDVEIPNLLKYIELANTSLATLDTAQTENKDQITVLRQIQSQLNTVTTSNTEANRLLLGDIQNQLGSDSLISSQTFYTDMKALDQNISLIFKAATDNARRLSICFYPVPTGVVTPWSRPTDPGDPTISKPQWPFPWDSATYIQNQDANLDDPSSAIDPSSTL